MTSFRSEQRGGSPAQNRHKLPQTGSTAEPFIQRTSCHTDVFIWNWRLELQGYKHKESQSSLTNIMIMFVYLMYSLILVTEEIYCTFTFE